MTRAAHLRAAAERLGAAGLDDAADEARRLLLAASDLSPARLLTEMTQPMLAEERAQFDALVARREQREPLSQILGVQPFWTLELKVTRDVLTPRADTETVIEAALAAFPDRSAPLRIMDIATGSGAIILALLSEFPNASGLATDLSEAALKVAAENAVRTQLTDRVRFQTGNWADGVSDAFDLVVSNPPYIATDVLDTLEPEVRVFEPRLALDGGVTGFGPYPHLFAEAARLLKSGGLALFEIGYDQGAMALQAAREAGAQDVSILKDLAGNDRVVSLNFPL
ncbi:peptide chain release factor N(5)-glutamine methyltransferase [Oceanicaulis alexandrii]|uniref:peptide chain release factor N(5)-glutamine methyltransferase n=1 Tax=Oceanicaulis alexandrii TaxID=153233 RepID=UPI002352EDBF|nr:peptide chain release factor N(5)-glutamine methyltransferase [Oceanicaulis alexandrii]